MRLKASVRNLQELNMDVKAGPDLAAPVHLFRSTYTQQGQKLTVTSTEAYRSVINASANFNKTVLVLEKK
jgi:hypothetical protein